MNGDLIRIGSRGSALALVQARLVSAALERQGHGTEVVIVETDGDRRAPDTAWGEGAFVVAIERALLDRRVDVAVHSAKDVPIEQDPRLRIAAYLPRADPRDALVVRDDSPVRRLMDLPPGTRVGTDSPRRTGFVRALRPDLQVHPLHGNVDTRLLRLDDGETDALVLACAGLDRLDLGGRIAERLAPEELPPAPGQGAIAVQIRGDDARTLASVAAIDDQTTRVAVETERVFLETSGGGCRAPIGALATVAGGDLDLLVGHADPDGSMAVFGRRRGRISDARSLAIELALELLPGTRARSGVPRVLVTRAADQSPALLTALRAVGLEPVLVPAIAIESDQAGGDLDRAARSLSSYHWIVVTSANGARSMVASAARVGADLGGARWAAIGEMTGGILEHEGIRVAFQPSAANGVTVATDLPIGEGDRVLVARSDLAGPGLAERLRQRGADVDDVVAYRTIEAPSASRSLLRQAIADGPFDAVMFTSGSTVRGLSALAESESVDVRSIPAVCIGPETADAATAAGFRVIAVAPTQDASALAATTAGAVIRQPQEIR